MKSTHWSAHTDPADWADNPALSPEDAAREMIESHDDDRASDIRDDLVRGGRPVKITVHGYVETTDIIAEDADKFDGYIDGGAWFRPTGETVTVVCAITYFVEGIK